MEVVDDGDQEGVVWRVLREGCEGCGGWMEVTESSNVVMMRL